jgi:hypothetical protein
MTLDALVNDPAHLAVPDGHVALDVWFDPARDDVHGALTRALDPTAARLLHVGAARGSLWPLPVVPAVPDARARLLLRASPDTDREIDAALRAIGMVGHWSLVQRHLSTARSDRD